MSIRRLRKLTIEQLQAIQQPRNEDDAEAVQWEIGYRKWCESNGDDPEDPDFREIYREATGETRPMYDDENDREGWEHNLLKD